MIRQALLGVRSRSVMLASQKSSSCASSHYSTNTDLPSSTPKRPSPYRLLTPTTFLSSFAALHVQGWRLTPLTVASSSVHDISEAKGDLQDRQLTQVYEFPSGKTGWKSLTAFSQRVMEEIAMQDHHPVIHIAPASDTQANLVDLSLSVDTGYVLQISTHTHTPLPPIGQPKDAPKPRPGITTKDVNLATRLEEVYGERA